MIRCGAHVIHALYTLSTLYKFDLLLQLHTRTVCFCVEFVEKHLFFTSLLRLFFFFLWSTVRGANCYSSNLVNDSDVRAFSYKIDFPRCHFSLHNCHLLKSFAYVLLDKLAWVITFRAGLALWKKKPGKRLHRADFSSVIWHQSREYYFLNSAGVWVYTCLSSFWRHLCLFLSLY